MRPSGSGPDLYQHLFELEKPHLTAIEASSITRRSAGRAL